MVTKMRWNNYIYQVTDCGVIIEKYLSDENTGSSGEEGMLKIPSQIDGRPVVEIGAEAFSENGALLSKIEVPSSVRRIGKGAFKMCMSLTELILHEGLEEIGAEALFLTPLTEVVLPDTVCRMECPWELSSIRFSISEKNPSFFTDGFCLYEKGDGTGRKLLAAFSESKLTHYCVPEGTTVIGEGAFAGSETLQRIEMPLSVHTIEATAFEGCQLLEDVQIPDAAVSQNPEYEENQGGFFKEQRSGNMNNLQGLRVIGENAFSHCISLRCFHLPSTVEEIGRLALSDTFGWSEERNGLEQITVNAANPHFAADEAALYEMGEHGDRYIVKYFGTANFWRIPDDVTRILPGAFRRASFQKCRIPNSVKDVGEDAFRECKNLKELELEETGILLYVPQEPVYRKDEITALFYSEERESSEAGRTGENAGGETGDRPENKRHKGADKVGILRLPEKWRDFAAFYPEMRERKETSWEGYIYDYRGYDTLFPTYLNLMVRCGMACCRLKYPVLLEEDTAAVYRRFVEKNMSEILQEIAKMQDINRLALLAELEFFTNENIEECIEVFAGEGKTKCTGFLLNYKREHLEEADFDFSL